MSAEIKAIQKILKANANSDALAAQQKFVPGISKAYGVYTPVLNEIARQYKEGGFRLVQELWQSDSWEEKILAGKLLGRIARKDPLQSLELVEKFSTEIKDWAVCDTLGMQALKPIVKTHQKEIFALASKLNKSPNPWQRRLSLVLVEWYTRDISTHSVINKLVSNLENDKEYYVQKAIVWIKKNFSKGK
jgi:3-methyladenine DNA glycosylase AlkD